MNHCPYRNWTWDLVFYHLSFSPTRCWHLRLLKVLVASARIQTPVQLKPEKPRSRRHLQLGCSALTHYCRYVADFLCHLTLWGNFSKFWLHVHILTWLCPLSVGSVLDVPANCALDLSLSSRNFSSKANESESLGTAMKTEKSTNCYLQAHKSYWWVQEVQLIILFVRENQIKIIYLFGRICLYGVCQFTEGLGKLMA